MVAVNSSPHLPDGTQGSHKLPVDRVGSLESSTLFINLVGIQDTLVDAEVKCFLCHCDSIN